jgi:adenylate cyclase
MKKTIIFLIIALGSSLIAFLLYRSASPFIQQVDLRLKDVRFQIRGTERPDPRVVVVAIDNKSVKDIGRWPWSREITASLLHALKDYGARVVALDIVFSEPQAAQPDRALAEAVKTSGNVTLGYFFRNEPQVVSPLVLEQVAGAQIKQVRLEEGVVSIPIPEFHHLDVNIATIGAGALDHGFFNVVPDDDGLFRKTPLLALFNDAIYPSLALKATSRYLEREARVEVAEFGIRTLALGELRLPVSEGGNLSLNYYGPGGIFTTVSAADVIHKRVAESVLQNALVFVGATETGIADIRATPFDPALPGVEIHATVAANALENHFVVRDSRTAAMEMAVIFLLPLLLALLLGTAPGTLTALGWFCFSICAYLAGNLYLFKSLYYDLSLIFPLVPLFICYTGCEAYRNLVIEKKGRYLKMAFGSYVSRDLVEEIVKNPDKLKLGGERREVTVLFSDIRGFTTLSESISPEELVSLLNSYLSPMTNIVLEERGTLDKYVGDAIMAIFNAPLDVPGHAEHSCRCAFRMLDRLKVLNRELAGKGIPELEIGIGVNTGEAIVGNMGADLRFDYTAIGDNVNLASRLESLNKHYGTRILVSESTRRQAGDSFVFREVDLVRVKGKNTPVAVYELMTMRHELAAPFADALLLYRNHEYDDALLIFSRLAESEGDRLSSMYRDRCEQFIASPPPDDWDGVYVAKTK